MVVCDYWEYCLLAIMRLGFGVKFVVVMSLFEFVFCLSGFGLLRWLGLCL